MELPVPQVPPQESRPRETAGQEGLGSRPNQATQAILETAR